MSLQQAEGWYLWAKSRSLRRQALRRTVVNVLVILSLLLTGTGLLGTPAFGDNWKETMDYGCRMAVEAQPSHWKETMGYWCRESVEAQESLRRCGLEFPRLDRDQYLAQVNKCLKDRQPRLAEAWRCMNPLAERCGYGKTFEEVWLEGMKAIEKIVKNTAESAAEDANNGAAILWGISALAGGVAVLTAGPVALALGLVAADSGMAGALYWYIATQFQEAANDPPRHDIDIVSYFKSPTFALPAPADDLEARWQAFNVKVVSTAVCLSDLVTSQERVDGALMVKDRHGVQSVPQLLVQMAAVQHNATACAKLLRELSLLKQPTNEAWHTLMDILKRHQIDPTTPSPQEIKAHLRTLWEKQKPQVHTQWGLSQSDIAELTQTMETGIERMQDRSPRLPDVLLDDKWVKNLESLAQALEQLALAYATGMPSGHPAQHSPPVPQR